MQELKPTVKELGRIVYRRKVAEIDKKISPFSWILLAVMLLGAVVALAIFSINFAPTTTTYILEDGQVLQIVSGRVMLEDKVLIAEEREMSSGIVALITPFATVAILSLLIMIGLVIYEYYAGYKARDEFLEALYKGGDASPVK